MANQSQVKQRILRAAVELFMEQGFAGTSVREIGERAGVGQSSLYHHTRSKDQLLRELHGSFAQEVIKLLEVVVSSEASPTVQLEGVIKAIMSVVDTHRAAVTVFLRDSYALPPEARTLVLEERDRIDAMVDSVLREGMKTGEFRSDLDVPLVRLAILGMCNWSYQWYNPKGERPMAEIADYFAGIVLPACVSPTSSRSRRATSPVAVKPKRAQPKPPQPKAKSRRSA